MKRCSVESARIIRANPGLSTESRKKNVKQEKREVLAEFLISRLPAPALHAARIDLNHLAMAGTLINSNPATSAL